MAMAVKCVVSAGGCGDERRCSVRLVGGKRATFIEQICRMRHLDWSPLGKNDCDERGINTDCYLIVGICGSRGRQVTIATWDCRDALTLTVNKSEIVECP